MTCSDVTMIQAYIHFNQSNINGKTVDLLCIPTAKLFLLAKNVYELSLPRGTIPGSRNVACAKLASTKNVKIPS